MLASLIIVFREVFEAGLVVGIVLVATRGVPRRDLWIAGGIAAGASGAAVLALFAGALSNALDGMGQEVFNASILLIASLMLAWHQLWMASHGREMAREMKALGAMVVVGERSMLAMAVVVAVAVLREGAEVVLFLYGIAAASNEGSAAVVVGGLGGIGLGAGVSFLLYRGLVAIPVRQLFAVTSWMIALLAAGMAGQAAAILAGADLLPAWGYQLWDTSWLLPQASVPGRTLHALIGYSDRPPGVQVATYVVVLAALVIGARLVHHRPSAASARRHAI